MGHELQCKSRRLLPDRGEGVFLIFMMQPYNIVMLVKG
ncbi:hypothetical protein EDO6_01287 [Paenibacillus xylanexedens]|nr:hypothetical protein EDO6_01287 [Paenibacillus xylanexedens]